MLTLDYKSLHSLYTSNHMTENQCDYYFDKLQWGAYSLQDLQISNKCYPNPVVCKAFVFQHTIKGTLSSENDVMNFYLILHTVLQMCEVCSSESLLTILLPGRQFQIYKYMYHVCHHVLHVVISLMTNEWKHIARLWAFITWNGKEFVLYVCWGVGGWVVGWWGGGGVCVQHIIFLQQCYIHYFTI
jgi:hypothetical protein